MDLNDEQDFLELDLGADAKSAADEQPAKTGKFGPVSGFVFGQRWDKEGGEDVVHSGRRHVLGDFRKSEDYRKLISKDEPQEERATTSLMDSIIALRKLRESKKPISTKDRASAIFSMFEKGVGVANLTRALNGSPLVQEADDLSTNIMSALVEQGMDSMLVDVEVDDKSGEVFVYISDKAPKAQIEAALSLLDRHGDAELLKKPSEDVALGAYQIKIKERGGSKKWDPSQGPKPDHEPVPVQDASCEKCKSEAVVLQRAGRASLVCRGCQQMVTLSRCEEQRVYARIFGEGPVLASLANAGKAIVKGAADVVAGAANTVGGVAKTAGEMVKAGADEIAKKADAEDDEDEDQIEGKSALTGAYIDTEGTDLLLDIYRASQSGDTDRLNQLLVRASDKGLRADAKAANRAGLDARRSKVPAKAEATKGRTAQDETVVNPDNFVVGQVLKIETAKKIGDKVKLATDKDQHDWEVVEVTPGKLLGDEEYSVRNTKTGAISKTNAKNFGAYTAPKVSSPSSTAADDVRELGSMAKSGVKSAIATTQSLMHIDKRESVQLRFASRAKIERVRAWYDVLPAERRPAYVFEVEKSDPRVYIVEISPAYSKIAKQVVETRFQGKVLTESAPTAAQVESLDALPEGYVFFGFPNDADAVNTAESFGAALQLGAPVFDKNGVPGFIVEELQARRLAVFGMAWGGMQIETVGPYTRKTEALCNGCGEGASSDAYCDGCDRCSKCCDCKEESKDCSCGHPSAAHNGGNECTGSDDCTCDEYCPLPDKDEAIRHKNTCAACKKTTWMGKGANVCKKCARDKGKDESKLAEADPALEAPAEQIDPNAPPALGMDTPLTGAAPAVSPTADDDLVDDIVNEIRSGQYGDWPPALAVGGDEEPEIGQVIEPYLKKAMLRHGVKAGRRSVADLEHEAWQALAYFAKSDQKDNADDAEPPTYREGTVIELKQRLHAYVPVVQENQEVDRVDEVELPIRPYVIFGITENGMVMSLAHTKQDTAPFAVVRTCALLRALSADSLTEAPTTKSPMARPQQGANLKGAALLAQQRKRAASATRQPAQQAAAPAAAAPASTPHAAAPLGGPQGPSAAAPAAPPTPPVAQATAAGALTAPQSPPATPGMLKRAWNQVRDWHTTSKNNAVAREQAQTTAHMRKLANEWHSGNTSALGKFAQYGQISDPSQVSAALSELTQVYQHITQRQQQAMSAGRMVKPEMETWKREIGQLYGYLRDMAKSLGHGGGGYLRAMAHPDLESKKTEPTVDMKNEAEDPVLAITRKVLERKGFTKPAAEAAPVAPKTEHAKRIELMQQDPVRMQLDSEGQKMFDELMQDFAEADNPSSGDASGTDSVAGSAASANSILSSAGYGYEFTEQGWDLLKGMAEQGHTSAVLAPKFGLSIEAIDLVLGRKSFGTK